MLSLNRTVDNTRQLLWLDSIADIMVISTVTDTPTALYNYSVVDTN